MNVSLHDQDILRKLAERKAEIAALPIQPERKKMWTRLNRLEKVRPMVWMDVNKAVKEAGGKYVFSLKPNPAYLAEDTWRPELAQKELETKLDIMRGRPVEIIMKDISTLRYEPKRLWEWAAIAMNAAGKYA